MSMDTPYSPNCSNYPNLDSSEILAQFQEKIIKFVLVHSMLFTNIAYNIYIIDMLTFTHATPPPIIIPYDCGFAGHY